MESSLYDLELRCIEPMSREELLKAIRQRQDCLPAELCGRLDEEPERWLRLLLMAARLIYALRMLREQYWAEQARLTEKSPLGHQGFTADRSRGGDGSAPGAEP